MLGSVVKKGSTLTPAGSLGFLSKYRVKSGGTRAPSPPLSITHAENGGNFSLLATNTKGSLRFGS